MARGKRTTARVPRDRQREFDDEGEFSPEEIDLIDFIEQVGPSIARVYIWRVPRHGDHEYIDKVEVSMLKDGAEEFLRDTYGAPAKYFLRFKGSDQRWKFSKMVNIGTPNKGEYLAGLNGSQSSSHQTSQASQRESELQKELQLMSQRQHEAHLKMLESLNRPPAAAPDPSAMLTSVITAFTALKAASTPDGGTDIKKLKEIMSVVNEFKTPP